MTFNCLTPQVVFQEVPDEISLSFSITGCQLGCKGCHSVELWDASNGVALTDARLHHWLDKYDGLISCVVFFGGEWVPARLADLLATIRQRGLKTCLYTGLDQVDEQVRKHLTYLKTGAWDAKLGGLNSPTTNQKFIEVSTGRCLNERFHK